LHERQAAATFAYCASDTPRNHDVIGSQVDIERNQKRTRAHGNCAGGRMDSFLADIRRAIEIRFDLRSKLLESFAAHFLQTDMIGIDVTVENSRAGNRFDRPLDALDGFGLAAFTEVWYTLHEIADCGLRIADFKNVGHEIIASV